MRWRIMTVNDSSFIKRGLIQHNVCHPCSCDSNKKQEVRLWTSKCPRFCRDCFNQAHSQEWFHQHGPCPRMVHVWQSFTNSPPNSACATQMPQAANWIYRPIPMKAKQRRWTRHNSFISKFLISSVHFYNYHNFVSKTYRKWIKTTCRDNEEKYKYQLISVTDHFNVT